MLIFVINKHSCLRMCKKCIKSWKKLWTIKFTCCHYKESQLFDSNLRATSRKPQSSGSPQAVVNQSSSIPILQAKFYYIPPLEGRFQSFWGIDIWNSIPHCWSYPIWCSTIGNWSIPHMWGIKIIMLYQFPTCGELKLSLLWRN